MEQKKYRAGVIGLGWMGFLYDLGKRDYERISGSYQVPIYDVESADRPLPDGLDINRTFYLYDHPGREGLATSYAAAFFDRPEVELVAGADRDPQRRAMFGERFGIEALYADALAMLDEERLDIVAIATNTKGRSALTVAAVDAGVRGVLVDKPMVFSLAEADAMVGACAEAGVPLVGGATSVSHPSFARAKSLVEEGAIGQVRSLEARVPVLAQHQDWSYFLTGDPVWVCGTGDQPRRERGSSEFMGQGMIACSDGTVVHIRAGAPEVRISGSRGSVAALSRRGNAGCRAGGNAVARAAVFGWYADGVLS
ncbi:MAG: Gfo/Idh/MocA family oxidoreductase [Candidatus Latescibacteria bacterium]|nr:Gfo/Idh/MocA family oxidoreductase [Candidatus Latescibacterota bacterium]